MRADNTTLEGILFDKDGTLIDYAATWLPLNRKAALLAADDDIALADRLLAVAGYDAEADRVLGGSLLAAAHTREIAEAWIAEGAPKDLETLVAGMDYIFAQGAARAVPVTDIAALFDRLQADGLSIGVATSDGEKAARATLAHLGVRTDSVFVAGYDSGHGGKPAPGMVHGFCAAAGTLPARVAVVGDNLHDLDMAKAAGCALAIAVLTGTGTADELASHADHVIASVAELEGLLVRERLLAGAAAGST